jgi:hypothetical protein
METISQSTDELVLEEDDASGMIAGGFCYCGRARLVFPQSIQAGC